MYAKFWYRSQVAVMCHPGSNWPGIILSKATGWLIVVLVVGQTFARKTGRSGDISIPAFMTVTKIW